MEAEEGDEQVKKEVKEIEMRNARRRRRRRREGGSI